MLLGQSDYPLDERRYINLLNLHYEYCYLESMHFMLKKEIHNNPYQVLVVGLSYALDDIEIKLLDKKTSILAMHSQDIYYDMQHIYHVLKEGVHGITDCIFTLGYYSFYYDLSMGGQRKKCLKTYGPLFDDLHHSIDFYKYLNSVENSINTPGFREWYHSIFLENPSYYGKVLSREDKSPLRTDDGKVVGWESVPSERRLAISEVRCQEHNNHYKHVETLNENIGIFLMAIKMLVNAKIRPHVIIPPFTEEYIRGINPNYKYEMLAILDEAPYEIDFIDFNDYKMFECADFADPDHLNLRGAYKFSEILNDLDIYSDF